MATPERRGGHGGWSLVQLAAEARVPRGVARGVVNRGYLPTDGFTDDHIVLLRVAAAALEFPGPGRLQSDLVAATVEERNRNALRYAKGMLADPQTPAGACLVLGPSTVSAVDDYNELPAMVARSAEEPVLVLPVGAWRRLLPANRPSNLTLLPEPNPRSAPSPETGPVTLAETAADVIAGLPHPPPTGEENPS